MYRTPRMASPAGSRAGPDGEEGTSVAPARGQAPIPCLAAWVMASTNRSNSSSVEYTDGETRRPVNSAWLIATVKILCSLQSQLRRGARFDALDLNVGDARREPGHETGVQMDIVVFEKLFGPVVTQVHEPCLFSRPSHQLMKG